MLFKIIILGIDSDKAETNAILVVGEIWDNIVPKILDIGILNNIMG